MDRILEQEKIETMENRPVYAMCPVPTKAATMKERRLNCRMPIRETLASNHSNL